MKFQSTIVIGIVASIGTITFTSVNAQNYPCNPANWCNDKSLLCKSAAAVDAILHGETLDYEHSRGVCTDAYRWICNSAGYNCKKTEYDAKAAWERCRTILNTNRNGREKIYPGKYVEACRAGEWTCGNGACVSSASGCDGKGGVKYSNVRCPKDSCGSSDVIKDICQMGTESIEGGQECAETPSANTIPCCPQPNGEQCRFLELENAGEIDVRQCGGDCPDSCTPTKSPVTAPTPTKKPAPTTPTNSPVANPASPTTTVPTLPPAPIVEYPPAGITVQFQQKVTERDCCCQISCDCFGDPHCTTFFGIQQTSKVSTGSFTMFKNLDISLEVFLGPPMGIIEHVVVTTSAKPGMKYLLNTKYCNNATHNWMNAETMEFTNDIPSNWDISPSLNPNGVGGFVDPSIYRVRDSKGIILYELTCQAFLWERPNGRSYDRYTRLDVVTTAWRDKVVLDSGEICCPSQEQNEEWLILTGATGFCVDPAATPIPGGINNRRRDLQQQTFHGRKLIGLTPEKEKAAFEQLKLNIGEELAVERHLQTAEEVCEAYLKAVGKAAIAALDTMEKCLQSVDDFGIGSIITLTEMINKGIKDCISSASDPRLPGPFGLKACQAGVILEVLPKGGNEWIPLQSFPADYPYCGNAITFDFNFFTLPNGKGLSAEDRYRLKQCAADTEQCGVCAPLYGLENVGFSFAYACATYDIYSTALKSTLLNGLKNGDFSCGFKYIGATDPLKCIKDYFPFLFE